MTTPTNEDKWRAMLTGESPDPPWLRRRFRRIPSPPRYKMCHAPFGGIGREAGLEVVVVRPA